MSRAILTLLVTLSFVCPAPIATAQTALSDLTKDLGTLVDDAISGGVPGILLRIERGGAILGFARGTSNLQDGTPIRPDDLIRMGSVTKLYTATIIHALVREGRTCLDCLAEHYLPAGTLDGIANGDTVTLRQLLQHTSGIPDFYDDEGNTPFDFTLTPLVPGRVLDAVRSMPPAGVPGEAYHYSNTGYHILALVAEAVSGETMDALYQRHVFEPAGLSRTQYETLFSADDRIHGYSAETDPSVDHYRWLENTGPDGGMLATATDISALLGALFTEDGALHETGAAMVSTRVKASGSEDYGLGVSILKRRSTGEEFYGHTGGIHGYLTIAVYDPRRAISIVLHINREDEEALVRLYAGVLSILSTLPASEDGRD